MAVMRLWCLKLALAWAIACLRWLKNAPETNFVGVEVHEPGIGRLVALADEAKLHN